MLLTGALSSPAIDATVDLPAEGVEQSLIDHHVILTRLDVRLAPDATVGQINTALMQIGGGIVSMSAHEPTMTVAVPRQPSTDALRALALTLDGAPGILFAIVGREFQLDVLPPSASTLLEEHTLPTRFPAAWNVMSLAARDCDTRRVPVLVPDSYVLPVPNSHVAFASQVPFFQYFTAGASGTATHGYDVTTTLAAMFDTHVLTGANPLAQCLDVRGIEVMGATEHQIVNRISGRFPASERFIVSFSVAFPWDCDVVTLETGGESCTRESIVQGTSTAFERGIAAEYWKKKTHDRWDDFFAAASAGNAREQPVGMR